VVRRVFWAVVVVALMGVGAAAADAPGLILEESFDGGTDIFSGGWGMEPLDYGHDGPGLKSIIPAGEHWGSSGHWYFADHGLEDPEELWWRYWVKFPKGFYIEPPNRGKLPGVAGLYTYNCLGGRPSTPEGPCFSARMLFSRDYPLWGEPGYPYGPDDRTLIGFYAYHLDSPATRGDIWTWDRDVAVLDHGQWYCVEGHIGLNTPGIHDGVLEGWVDGAAAFSKSDIAFRRASEGGIDIKSFWFDVYYGGSESIVENEIHFDSLAFGSERIGCEDGGKFDPPFRDDDATSFETDINWLAASGITAGCNPPVNDRFCPDANVTRGQMAAFLVRALGLTDDGDGDLFDDDDGSIFEGSIDKLATAGITKGCNPSEGNTKFCPNDPVTRGQMAAFLARAMGYADNNGGDLFVDDDGSIFESAIDKLATAGVTRGCNPAEGNTMFCPHDYVTRGQMAAFLHRALG